MLTGWSHIPCNLMRHLTIIRVLIVDDRSMNKTAQIGMYGFRDGVLEI